MRYLAVALTLLMFPVSAFAQSQPRQQTQISSDDAAQSAYASAQLALKREMEANAMVIHLSHEIDALRDQLAKATAKPTPEPTPAPASP